jgi:hypothetical protein
MGRRLKKKFTYHNGSNTDVTTYKYHYIGGQITEIEIDSIRNPGEGQTVLRDEEVKIHLGANSQPISYEWVKHVGGNTTQATYYYHYDIHGNVLKITDSSENVKITYTYDVLGKILTETNPDNILNFFTFRGASQTIWDSEVGMYYSGGYYRPDTGTALQGTGAPVLTNPATGSMLKAMAKVNQANVQLKVHAVQAASTAGSSSGGAPGGFRPPSGPSDGIAHSGKNKPSRPPDPTPPPTDGCKLGKIRVRKGGGLHTIEAISSDPMNPVKPGTTTVFEPLDDESEGDGDGSGISYVVAIFPITNEVDASQLQPEQSDETFEAVYIWDKPGGGGEMSPMFTIPWKMIYDKIIAGLKEIWKYLVVFFATAWLTLGLDKAKASVCAGILGHYTKNLPKSYRDYLTGNHSSPGPGVGMINKTGAEILIEQAQKKGKSMRKEGWTLQPGTRETFWKKYGDKEGDYSKDDYDKLTGDELFDLILTLAMADYDSEFGIGAATKDPIAFERWLRTSEWRNYLVPPPCGPPPKPGSVDPGDYPIKIQPKPIIPEATTTSYYKIREIHKEKVQV